MKNPKPRPHAGKPGPSSKPPAGKSGPSFKPPAGKPGPSAGKPPSSAPSSHKPPPKAPLSQKPPNSSKPNPSKKGKSRWEPRPNSQRHFNNKPISISSPIPHPHSSASPALRPPIPHPQPPVFSLPPPPPPYGFQNLDRRTIVLADGAVRSYFALPPDEPIIDPYGPPIHGGPVAMDRHFPPPHENPYVHRPGLQPLHFEEPSIGKRKYGHEDDELARQRLHVLQYGNPNLLDNNPRVSKHARIDDTKAVRKSFLKFVKIIYENPDLKKKYSENTRTGPLHCLACSRASKECKDIHELITHSYYSPEDRADHLGLHKALCVLMGWNYKNAPDDNNKSYMVLSPEEAQSNRYDLILWPPTVIIHNTSFGRKKDGRFEGFSNKDMDNILKDLGFPGGKARSIYSREGHMGVTIVQFLNTETGLNEAERLTNYFERQNHDRNGWVQVRPVIPSEEDDRNPLLVKKDERTGEKKRVLYGYLASVVDLDSVDFDARKRVCVKSRKEFDLLD